MTEIEANELLKADRTTLVRRVEAEPAPLTAREVLDQIQLIQEVMATAMKDGEHYGKIPGCGDKPALLKPGAEKLSLLFRLAPQYHITDIGGSNGHREYRVVCRLMHRSSGMSWGEGVGSCSTMETKYRWRGGSVACPECGRDLRRSKQSDEWYCWRKTGGCGATFPLASMKAGERTENPDIADTYNTVLKMAKKRAHVDACLTATAASDIFAQDIDEEHIADQAGRVPPIDTANVKGAKPDATVAEGWAAVLKAHRAVHPDTNETDDAILDIYRGFLQGKKVTATPAALAHLKGLIYGKAAKESDSPPTQRQESKPTFGFAPGPGGNGPNVAKDADRTPAPTLATGFDPRNVAPDERWAVLIGAVTSDEPSEEEISAAELAADAWLAKRKASREELKIQDILWVDIWDGQEAIAADALPF